MSHAYNACSHGENRLKICLLCTRKIKTKLSSLSPKSIELIRNHVLTDYNISDERGCSFYLLVIEPPRYGFRSHLV